jgi:hypothetical protein
MCSEVDCISDRSGKADIAPFSDDLCADLVSKIEQKHFTHVDDGDHVKVGFIADEVDAVFPNAVTRSRRGGNPKYQSLSYNQMAAVLWGAVRSLQARVAAHDLLIAEISEVLRIQASCPGM